MIYDTHEPPPDAPECSARRCHHGYVTTATTETLRVVVECPRCCGTGMEPERESDPPCRCGDRCVC